MPLPTELVLFRRTPPIELPQPPLTIQVPEAWRAEVYLPALEEARVDLDSYGQRWPQVGAALRAPALIQQLAEVLDNYLAPCIVADVNAFAKTRFPGQNITEATYLQYIGTCLQGGADPYQPSAVSIAATPTPQPWAGIDPLFRRYPLMRYMLSIMASQYVSNLLRCCERLVEDWQDINTFFFGPPLLPLVSLTEIRGTGSDFHKGGQQVLLLSFLNTLNAGQRLVYKPSDVERDFRIVGDTQALGMVINNLPTLAGKGVTPGNLLNNAPGSLVEMVTTFAGQAGINAPVTKYKILPVHPGTSLAPLPNGGYDVRQSYGWIQFLSTDQADRDMPNLQQISDYYEAFGTMLALAYTFQITDMHQENILVHQLQPYLIDLEMAYSGIIARPDGTGMQGAYKQFAAPDLGQEVGGWNLPQLSYGAPSQAVPTKNQPYYQNNPYTPTTGDAQTVWAAFLRAVTLILNNAVAFDGWLAAAAGVIARLVPFGTSDLITLLRAVHRPGSPIAASRPDEVRLRTEGFTRWPTLNIDEGRIDGWGDHFVVTTNGVLNPLDLMQVYHEAQPRFTYWLSAQTAEDFKNGDVPAFYQKSSTAISLDSRGNPVAISFDPAIQMTTANNQVPLATMLTQVWNPPAPLLPSTYFPEPVTTTQRAYLAQLQNNPGFRNTRMTAAQQQISGW